MTVMGQNSELQVWQSPLNLVLTLEHKIMTAAPIENAAPLIIRGERRRVNRTVKMAIIRAILLLLNLPNNAPIAKGV
jgi:hypothetical protein